MRWRKVEADLCGQVEAFQSALKEKERELQNVLATLDKLQNGPKSKGLRT